MALREHAPGRRIDHQRLHSDREQLRELARLDRDQYARGLDRVGDGGGAAAATAAPFTGPPSRVAPASRGPWPVARDRRAPRSRAAARAPRRRCRCHRRGGAGDALGASQRLVGVGAIERFEPLGLAHVEAAARPPSRVLGATGDGIDARELPQSDRIVDRRLLRHVLPMPERSVRGVQHLLHLLVVAMRQVEVVPGPVEASRGEVAVRRGLVEGSLAHRRPTSEQNRIALEKWPLLAIPSWSR